MAGDRQLTVMVSSTVYGIEELLERIYSLLTGFGYEVWMSHKGTVQVYSTKAAFDCCLDAVEECDLFLSLITTSYGSGKDSSGISITHQELIRAIELNKPRWVLASEQVVFAQKLLRYLGHDSAEKRALLNLKKNKIIDDLRVIDMYEAAILHDVQLADKKGNWVQQFINPDDALLYASAQFYRYHEVEKFIEEHFRNVEAAGQKVKE